MAILKSVEKIIAERRQKRLEKAREQAQLEKEGQLSKTEEKRLLLLLGKFNEMNGKMDEMSEREGRRIQGIFSKGINVNNFPKPVRPEDYSKKFDRLIECICKLEKKVEQIELKPNITVPEVRLPKINVPEANVKVSVPKIEAPKVSVKVDNDSLKQEFKTLKKVISEIRFNYTEKDIDLGPILAGLKKIELKLKEPQELDLEPLIDSVVEVRDSILNLRFPVPTPVTQFDMNPLRGVPKSTAVTVGATVTKLPGANLANRRSLIVYNTDTSKTLYIGGSSVSTSNGFPVAPESYSPPIDAGSSMTIYGIAESNINVRVLEVSNDSIGSA